MRGTKGVREDLQEGMCECGLGDCSPSFWWQWPRPRKE